MCYYSESSYSTRPLTPPRPTEHLSQRWVSVDDHSEWSPAFVPLTSLIPSFPSLPRSLSLSLSASPHPGEESRPLSCCPAQQISVSLTACCTGAVVVNEPLGTALHLNPGRLCVGSYKKRLVWMNSFFCVCFPSLSKSFFPFSVVEDDEDDFPNTRTDGEFLHNNNGSKEKRE